MFTSHRSLTLAVVCLGLSACAELPRHNNTLIFSVKRDVGIALAGPSESSPSGELSIGFKERQMAWVPIWANGSNGAMPCGPASNAQTGSGAASAADSGRPTDFRVYGCNHGPKLLADGEGSSAKGGRYNDAHDALSTFSSFGGDFQGRVGSDASRDSTVSGRMASFFATGIAAQNLSKQMGLVSPALERKSTEDPSDKTLDQRASDLKAVIAFIQSSGMGVESGNSARLVRVECADKLAERAELRRSLREAFAQFRTPTPPAASVTVDLWEMRFRDGKKQFEADLPFLSRAASSMSAGFEDLVRQKGAIAAAAEICGPAPSAPAPSPAPAASTPRQ